MKAVAVQAEALALLRPSHKLLIMKDRNGRARMPYPSRRRVAPSGPRAPAEGTSPMQPIQFPDVQMPALAMHGDDDGQGQRHFGRGHGHGEQREQAAGFGSPI